MGGKTEHKCVTYNNCLWFTGGYNGQDYTNDTYMYDPVTGTSCLIETLGERFSPRSALTVVMYNDKMYTFGGWNGFSRKWFNDLHELDIDTRRWRRIEAKGDVPTQRTSHAAVVKDKKMYVFGGFSGETYLNDLYEFNFGKCYCNKRMRLMKFLNRN
jgi:N-acetylneuraminic acid mutarotase